MILGLQTISWGREPNDIVALVKGASRLGFAGLELAQRVEALGSPKFLLETLLTHDMRLAGLAGGTLLSRIEYAEILRPDYLYLDDWDKSAVDLALERNLCVAVHPHLYKDIETLRDAERLLKRYPQLKLIVDTAHAYLAGDDVVAALKRYSERIAAVHLKDWTSRFGRSPIRFARGFTALGSGELSDLIAETLDTLAELEYRSWVIIEQDTAHGHPLDCASESLAWLRRRGMPA